MGLVKSVQSGKAKASGKAKKAATDMDPKDVDDFASTKHDGLPYKVKKETKVRRLIRNMVREIMDEMNEGLEGALKKEDRKSFDKMRRKQSEVLGYTLTGKDDLRSEVGDATVNEAKERNYKEEYKKYGSSKKAKKYRAELNAYNRKKGTYGNGDKKDASHKGGKIVGFEAESKNRGRAEKSRLKKEHIVKFTKDEMAKLHKDGKIEKADDDGKMHTYTFKEGKNKGLWHNIHKKRKRGEKPAKKGDKNYPKTLNIEGKLNEGSDTFVNILSKFGFKKGARDWGGHKFFVHKSKNLYATYNPSGRSLVIEPKRGGKPVFDTDRSNFSIKALLNYLQSPSNKFVSTEGKLTEKKMDRKKAAIILKQIGGNRFIAMTGAKDFAFSDKYMSFKIGRNSKGINFVRIGHNAMDTYDMEFGFVSIKGIKVKKKVKGVYADMLGTMFKKYTGMNVSL
jgi:hypothetical protein